MSCTTSWITSVSTSLSVSTSYSYSYSSSVYTYNARARRSFQLDGESSSPAPTPTTLEIIPTGAPLAARQAPETTPAPTPAGNSPLNVVGGPPSATAAPVVRRDEEPASYKDVSPAEVGLIKRQIGGLDGEFCPISAPYRFGSAQCGQERCYTNLKF